MYEDLIREIEEGNWESASGIVRSMEKEKGLTEQYYSLAATVEIALGKWDSALRNIRKGLALSPMNYEFFFQLALWYENRNPQQYLLCLHQALWYCKQQLAIEQGVPLLQGKEPEIFLEPEEDHLTETGKDYLALQNLVEKAGERLGELPEVTILILSYNDLELMKLCLDSIWETVDPGHTEVVVVDNASTDGTTEWLNTREDIRLIRNEENLGFPAGCNRGIAEIHRNHDLFLLNNDTALMPNSLFWLRMALYEEKNMGAVGPVSNRAVAQSVVVDPAGFIRDSYDVPYGLQDADKAKEEIRCWKSIAAEKINLPAIGREATEERCRLTGFAVLLRGDALPYVRTKDEGIFDTAFSPAYFEDDDLGMRMAAAGFRQGLVHNSFVWHAGGNGFQEGEYEEAAEPKPMSEECSGKATIMEQSRATFLQKWSFDMWAYELPEEDVLQTIEKRFPDSGRPLRVLQIGAGMGATLSALQYRYPNGIFIGTEENGLVAGLGRHMAKIYVMSPEEAEERFSARDFDVVLRKGQAEFPSRDSRDSR